MKRGAMRMLEAVDKVARVRRRKFLMAD